MIQARMIHSDLACLKMVTIRVVSGNSNRLTDGRLTGNPPSG